MIVLVILLAAWIVLAGLLVFGVYRLGEEDPWDNL